MIIDKEALRDTALGLFGAGALCWVMWLGIQAGETSGYGRGRQDGYMEGAVDGVHQALSRGAAAYDDPDEPTNHPADF